MPIHRGSAGRLTRHLVVRAIVVVAAIWLMGAASALAAPSVASVAPADGAVVANTPRPGLSVVTSDVAAPAIAVFEIDGTPYPATADAGGTVFTYTPAVDLPDGSHEATFSVTDALGRSASRAWSFEIDYVPEIYGFWPTPGSSTAMQQPSVRATVYDNAAFIWELKVDGSHVAGSPGAVAMPNRNFPVGGRPFGVLSNGTHTAAIEVRDAQGRTFAQSWSFTVANNYTNIAITSELTPGQPFTTPRPAPHFSATSNRTLTGVGIAVDGVNQTIAGPVYSNGNMTLDATLTPLADLSDGPHSIVVQASDSGYAQFAKQFDIEVQVPPAVFHLRPSGDVVQSDTTPQLIARATDNTDSMPTFEFTIDGSPVAESSRRIAFGRFEGTAQIDAALTPDATYTAQVTVTDRAGNVTARTWEFRITSGQRMSHYDAKASCTECHTTPWAVHSGRIVYDEPYPCNACHTSFATHSSLWKGAVLEDPSTYMNALGSGCSCHDPAKTSSPYDKAHSVWINSYACRSCHEGVNRLNDLGDPPNGRGVTEPLMSETPRHDTSSDMTECGECHSSELTVEHQGKTGSNGNGLDCQSCHASAAPSIQAAIASGDTACDACHADTSHAGLHATGFPLTCGECHTANLATEHVTNRGIACGACHESADPTVTSAVAAGEGNCAACHVATAHASSHASLTSSTCFGAGCHDASKNLAVVHKNYAGPESENPEFASACELCHDNPAVDTSSSGTRCTGACHSGVTHTGRTAGHAFSSPTSQFCATCHGATIEDAHGAYADLTRCGYCHDDPLNWNKSAECSTCHASAHSQVHEIDGTCTTSGCHPSNAMSIHATPGCESCHGTGKTPSFACVTCHASDPHPAGTHATQVTCNACHAVSDLISVHGRDCKTCHPGPADGDAWNKTCEKSGCHSNLHADLQFEHERDWMVRDFGEDCWTCHTQPTSQWNCQTCHPVARDTTAPNTTSNARPTYAGGAIVTLTATNPGSNPSGIGSVHYRLDGGPVMTGTTVSVGAPASGTDRHTLEFWSTDKALNSETPHVVSFEVLPPETIAPVTTSDAKAAYTGPATIKLNATDEGGSGVAATYYKLDGGAQQTGATISVSSPGSHTLEYWSVDHSGNAETPHKTANFTISSGTGTIRLAWNSPPEGSWARATITNGDGVVIYQSTSWSPPGWFIVNVPVSTKPYSLRIQWYDSSTDDEGVSLGTALIDSSGKTVTWWY